MSEWSKVSDAELRGIWDEARRTNRVFNGCTHAALVTRYGAENVRHESGVGWFVRRGEG